MNMLEVHTREKLDICMCLCVRKFATNGQYIFNFAKMFAYVNFNCKFCEELAERLHTPTYYVCSVY